MTIDLEINPGLTLQIASESTSGRSYPTARIQRGLVLLDEGRDLCEEAVGFGVPILKYGLRTIFPGEMELSPLEGGYPTTVHARYAMNLEEKIGKPGSRTINNPILYGGKNFLAAMIRRLPSWRRLLTHTSNLVRSWFSLETTYEPVEICTYLSMTYALDARTGRIKVRLEGYDREPAGITEVIVMNEQGAHNFDQYQDTDGTTLQGKEIGCWDQVLARQATFISHEHKVKFTLAQVQGARLYRGRELVANRLAWAGFGYSFPPSLEHYNYEIVVARSA